MTPRFVFHPAARDELRDARDWYETQRSGLGYTLSDQVSAALARIAQFPEWYPQVMPGVRRAVLARFPYSVFYRAQSGNSAVIEILAVFHHRRDPAVWRGRAAV